MIDVLISKEKGYGVCAFCESLLLSSNKYPSLSFSSGILGFSCDADILEWCYSIR